MTTCKPISENIKYRVVGLLTSFAEHCKTRSL